MKINESTLAMLGFEKFGDSRWELKSRGYAFQILEHADPYVNHGQPTYHFFLSLEDSNKGWQYGHSVDHVSELLGFAADDMYEEGVQAGKRSVLEALGVDELLRQEREKLTKAVVKALTDHEQ